MCNSSPAYMREYRRWRKTIEGRCQALCTPRHGRIRCSQLGVYVGPAGAVLCRQHETIWFAATGEFRVAA